MNRTQKMFHSLTGLRGLFILMIVIHHMEGYFGAPFSSYLHLPYRWGGVMGNSFFFMLSGFVISYGYREKILQGQTAFGGFIRKRLAKVYPMYLITDLVQACFLVYEQGMILNFRSIMPNVFMITTGWVDDIYPYNVSCWFVSVLFLCYILYYVLCRLPKGHPGRLLYFEIGMVLWGYLLLSRGWDFPFCYSHDGEGILNFFGGCVLYEVYEKNGERGNRRLTGLLSGSLAVFMFLAYQAGFEQFSGDSRLPFAFLVSPAAILLALEVRWIGNVLKSPLPAKLGQISMNVFYWHMPIIVFFNILAMKGCFDGIGNGARFLAVLLLILVWAAVLGKIRIDWGRYLQ